MTALLIRAVVCRVGQPAVVEMVEPSYEVLSNLVGGLVEFAYVSDGVELVANEEGAINGMPFNREVPAHAPPLPAWLRDAVVVAAEDGLLPPGSDQVGVHEVHGDFMVCGAGLTSLTEQDADRLAELLNSAAGGGQG